MCLERKYFIFRQTEPEGVKGPVKLIFKRNIIIYADFNACYIDHEETFNRLIQKTRTI